MWQTVFVLNLWSFWYWHFYIVVPVSLLSLLYGIHQDKPSLFSDLLWGSFLCIPWLDATHYQRGYWRWILKKIIENNHGIYPVSYSEEVKTYHSLTAHIILFINVIKIFLKLTYILFCWWNKRKGHHPLICLWQSIPVYLLNNRSCFFLNLFENESPSLRCSSRENSQLDLILSNY